MPLMKPGTKKASMIGSLSSIVVVLVLSLSVSVSRPDHAVPRPLTFSIDDCGWQGGASLAQKNGPWRLGARDPTLDDYQEIIRIGRTMGTRILSLWIMSELDKNQICAQPKYNQPLALSDMTELGLSWTNEEYRERDLDALMKLVKEQAAWIEFGLHGVRHEHFEQGQRQRAEFGFRDGGGFGVADAGVHLACFEELMRQYYPEEVSSFPRSFVPPYHGYQRTKGEEPGVAQALVDYGVKYAQKVDGGFFDAGLYMADRSNAGPVYDTPGEVSQVLPDEPWLMTHLPNFYDASGQWIDWLKRVQSLPHRYVPKNTAQAFSQILYLDHASFSSEDDHNSGTLFIDNRDMPSWAYRHDLLSTLLVKLKLEGDHISRVKLDKQAQVVGCYESSAGYGYLVIGHAHNPMGRLDPDSYTLRWERGSERLSGCVDLQQASFNVYAIHQRPSALQIDLEMYGRQQLQVRLDRGPSGPIQASTTKAGLTIHAVRWDQTNNLLQVDLSGQDIQGQSGSILISW